MLSSEPFNPQIRQLLEITRPKQPTKEQFRSFNTNQNSDPYFDQKVLKSPSNFFRADLTANALQSLGLETIHHRTSLANYHVREHLEEKRKQQTITSLGTYDSLTRKSIGSLNRSSPTSASREPKIKTYFKSSS